MRLVILESPYGSSDPSVVERNRNIVYARRCLRDCLARRESPIASHLLFTQPGVLDDSNLGERTLGMAAGHAWIAVAHAVVVYTDRGVSKGMQDGINLAIQNNIPIEYRTLGPGNFPRD